VVDSVNIENVGGDQGIASEITLQRLLATMELMASKTGKDSAAAVKKAKEQYKKSIVELDEKTKKAAESKVKNTKATKQATKATDKYTVAIGLVSGSLATLYTSVTGLATQLLTGGSSMAEFTSYIPILGSGISVLAGYLDNTFESFRTLSMTGASFNNNLNELRVASARARLNLDQFTNVVSKNSEILAAFGGTATKGAKAMAEMTAQLGDQRQMLLGMGFNFEEINEAMINYAYLTRTQGRIEQRSAREVAQRAAEYASTLQTLSKLTGKSVDQLKDEQREAQLGIAFQTKMANMSAKQQAKITAGLAEAAQAGPTAMARFKEEVLGMPPLTRETQLFATSLSETSDVITQSARDAMNSMVSVDEYNARSTSRMSNVVSTVLNSAENLEEVLAAGAASGQGVGAEIAQIINSMGMDVAQFMNKTGEERQKAIDKVVAKAKEEQDSRDSTTKAMSTFSEAIANVRSALTEAFVTSGILTLFTDGMNEIMEILGDKQTMGRIKEFLQGFADSLRGWIRSFGEDPETAWAELKTNITTGIKDTLIEGFKSIFTNPAVIAGVVTAIGGLFAANKIADMIGNRRSGAGGTTKGRSVGGTLGKGVGDLIGGVGAGVMRGAAAGLSAFASPVVAAGAGVLAIAIAAIGKAVSYATEETGRSLPVFAEGLKSFEKLDGPKLASVSDGIYEMSKGLAAFAGSKLFSTGAGVWTKIGETISGWLGGEGPLEQLKRFGREEINTEGVLRNAEALNTFGTAFQALARSDLSNLDFDVDTGSVLKLKGLSEVDGVKMQETAKAMQMFADVRGFETKLKGLKDLDTQNIDKYRESLDKLVATLEDLNRELMGGNGYGPDRRTPETTAGDILNQTNGNRQQNDVNTSALLSVLEEIRDLQKKSVKAINGISDSAYSGVR